jgi:hypothetical protein
MGFDYCFASFSIAVVQVYEERVSSAILLVVCFDYCNSGVAFQKSEVGSVEVWEVFGWLGLSHLFPFAGRDGK